MPLNNIYTGANGALTLANEDTPEGRDAQAVINAYGIQTVGRVSGVEVCIQTGLEGIYEIGRRHPVSLHSGNIEISGRVNRAYINGALLFLLQGRGSSPTSVDEIASPFVQPVFNMTVSLGDPAVPGNALTLELQKVKFQNWSFGLMQDDFVVEKATFKAVAIRVIDRQAGEGGGEPVAVVPEGFGGQATA
jgi:hypothetical protein